MSPRFDWYRTLTWTIVIVGSILIWAGVGWLFSYALKKLLTPSAP